MKKLFLYFIFFYFFFNIEGNAKIPCSSAKAILQDFENKRIKLMCGDVKASEYSKCYKKWTTNPIEAFIKAEKEGSCERLDLSRYAKDNSDKDKLEQRIREQEDEIQILKNKIIELEERLN